MPRKPFEADPDAIAQKQDSLSKLDEKPMTSIGGKREIAPADLPKKSVQQD